MPFSAYLNLFTTYIPINFLNNNLKNDFNLGIKLTKLNGPLSTNQIVSQIVNHFVSHYANQNDKVQFDSPIVLDIYKTIRPN